MILVYCMYCMRPSIFPPGKSPQLTRKCTIAHNTLSSLICKVPQETSTRSLRPRDASCIAALSVSMDRHCKAGSETNEGVPDRIGNHTPTPRGSSIATAHSFRSPSGRGSPEFFTSFAIRPSILSSLSLTMVTVRLCSRTHRAAFTLMRENVAK